jgi:hypothetical protein
MKGFCRGIWRAAAFRGGILVKRAPTFLASHGVIPKQYYVYFVTPYLPSITHKCIVTLEEEHQKRDPIGRVIHIGMR